jgi:autotransporter-associated beta strand protein
MAGCTIVRYWRGAAIACLAAVIGTAARAADNNWTNSSTSYQEWTTGTNWSLGSAPTGSQNAYITTGGWAKIDSAVSFSSLTIGGTSQVEVIGNSADLSASGPIIDNNVLIFSQLTNLFTVSQPISGNGSVTYANDGEFLLLGENTYTGGTIVNDAWLRVGGNAFSTTGSITGNVSVNGASGILTFDRQGTVVFGGVISGAGQLYQDPTNNTALVLTGNNTYTGGTTLNRGTIQIGNGGTSGSISGNIVDHTTLIFNRSDTITYGGIISTNGGVTQAGTGTLVLTGVNSYTGTTVVVNGTLALNGIGSIASSSGVIVDTNGVFDISGTTSGASIGVLDGGGAGVTLGSKTLTLNGGNFSSAISGTGGLSLTGNGELLLTGANNYTGGTTVSGGTVLRLGNGGATGSIVGNITNNGALFFNRSDAVTYAGIVSGSGSLTQAGTGTLALIGANTYSGGTLITAGLVNFNTNNNLGSGTITLNGGGLQWATGTATDISSRLAALGANGGTFDTNGNNVTFASPLSGAGGLIKAGTGTLTINAANSYTGATAISAGTLVLNSAGSIAASSGVADNGTFDISGTTSGAAITSLSGSGGVTLGSRILTLTNASGTFAGIISGTGGLTLTGGTETLTGTNSYSGGTTVASGATLAVSGGGAIAASSSLAVAGTFDISQTTGSQSAGASAVEINNLSGGGTVALGSKILVLDGTGTFSGVIQDGGIAGGSGGVLAPRGTETLTGVSSFHGSVSIASNATLALAGNGSIANAAITQGGTFDISQTLSGATIAGLDNGGVVALGSKTLTLANATSRQFGGVIQDGGIAGGSGGGLAITSGTQTLSSTNSYTGATTIATGATLTVAKSDAVTSSSSILDNGTFDISQGGATIKSLSGTGIVALGNRVLTLTAAADTFSGVIKDSTAGGLTLAGGSLVLSGTNVYTGTTTISAGTLALSGAGSIAASAVAAGGTFDISGTTSGAAISSLSGSGGVTLGSRVLTLTNAGGAFSGIISGSGGLTLAGGTETLTGANTYTGGTTISSGTLQIGSGGTSGSITGNITDNSAITFNRSDTIAYAGLLSGSGSLAQTGTGTLTLTGLNSYTGGTTISAGTLQIGSGGSLASGGALAVNGGTFDLNGQTQTVGALSGSGGSITLGTGALTTSSPTSTTLASVIGGSGSVSKAGTGTLTLSAANTYAGGTTISGGALNVAGTIGTVSVASGGTLAGTGKVGATSVASGGTLSPGTSGTPGTLTMTGTLNLASGANYATSITPSTAGLTAVTGTASVNGALTANALPGTYAPGQRYTVISTTGGVSGTFASLSTTGLPDYVKGRLSYDPNNVYLNLDQVLLTSLLSPSNATGQTGTAGGTATGTTTSTAVGTTGGTTSGGASSTGIPTNIVNVTSAIDSAISAGKTPNSGITSLFALSGTNLQAALVQATGGGSAQTSQATGQSFSPFFSLLMGRGAANDSTSVASNGVPTDVKPAQMEEGVSDVWASAFGGHTGISANAVTGASSLSSNAVGLAVGAEAMFADQLLAGASIGIGHQSYRSGSGSNGKSGDVMLGLYGHNNFGEAYVSAAFGYGRHAVQTMRIVTISGTDVLTGKFDATDIGGRAETGYRFDLGDELGLTPFAAFAAQDFHTPAYAETAASGSKNFALSYAANDAPTSHTELGTRLNRNFTLEDGTLSLEGLLGWTHQLRNSSSAQAAFQSLPNSGFVLVGIKPASDTALLGLVLEKHDAAGLVYGARVQSAVGPGTQSITGTINLAYRW